MGRWDRLGEDEGCRGRSCGVETGLEVGPQGSEVGYCRAEGGHFVSQLQLFKSYEVEVIEGEGSVASRYLGNFELAACVGLRKPTIATRLPSSYFEMKSRRRSAFGNGYGHWSGAD